jgi:hypothetical protein
VFVGGGGVSVHKGDGVEVGSGVSVCSAGVELGMGVSATEPGVLVGTCGTYNLCPERITLLVRQLAFFNSDSVIRNLWLMPKSVSPGRTIYTIQPVGTTTQVKVGAAVFDGIGEGVMVGVDVGPASVGGSTERASWGVGVKNKIRARVGRDNGASVAGKVKSS